MHANFWPLVIVMVQIKQKGPQASPAYLLVWSLPTTGKRPKRYKVHGIEYCKCRTHRNRDEYYISNHVRTFLELRSFQDHLIILRHISLSAGVLLHFGVLIGILSAKHLQAEGILFLGSMAQLPSAELFKQSKTVQDMSVNGDQPPQEYIVRDCGFGSIESSPALGSIPVIDISSFSPSSSLDPKEVEKELAKLRSALSSGGCFQVMTNI